MKTSRVAKRLQGVTAILLLGTITAWSAEVKEANTSPSKQIQVKVDGLSCPFCAFGLEKHLKKVEGTKKVTIYVDKGQAILQLKKDALLDAHAVSEAVKKGGFTPRKITVTTVGRIIMENERWLLHPSGVEQVFLLSENDKLKQIQRSKILDKDIVITGVIHSEHPRGHGEHPDVLEIQDYRVFEEGT